MHDDHLGHSDGSISLAVEGLNSHDLEVVVAWNKAMLGPVVEVVGSGDCTGSALALADREELLEGAGAGDRGFIGAGVGAHLVGAAVRGETAKAGCAGARVVIAVVLDDVVLGLWGVQPTVDGKV